jgi:hypothetical protein
MPQQGDDYDEEYENIPFDALHDPTQGDDVGQMEATLFVSRTKDNTTIVCRIKLPNGDTQEKTHTAPFAMGDAELRKATRNTINWCVRISNGKH